MSYDFLFLFCYMHFSVFLVILVVSLKTLLKKHNVASV